MRLPTTRLANCTGMRRWPFSMMTMATSTPMNRMMSGISRPRPLVALICANCDGMLDTTLAKINNDMPLPMPRCVTVSPIHMSRDVPAVSTSTTRSTRGGGEVGQDVDLGRVAGAAQQTAAAVVEQERQRRRLQHRDGHREVAGPLGDLALADGPLLLPLLQLGDDHRQDLHDDRAGDVGHDAQREDGEVRQARAREELQVGEHATRLLGLALQRRDGVEIDARSRHVGAEPVEGEHAQREQDLVPEVGDPEHVPQAGQHDCSPSAASTERRRTAWRPSAPVLPESVAGAQSRARHADV